MKIFLLSILSCIIISCQSSIETENPNVNSTVVSEEADVNIDLENEATEFEVSTEELTHLDDNFHPIYGPDLNAEVCGYETYGDYCLPYPDQRFLKDISENKMELMMQSSCFYYYLQTHLDSAKRETVETDSTWGVVKWKQRFDIAIMYEEYVIPEKGGGGSLHLPCGSKQALVLILDKVLEYSDDTHVWNSDSTEYNPIEEIGTRYSIKKTSETGMSLVWTFGC